MPQNPYPFPKCDRCWRTAPTSCAVCQANFCAPCWTEHNLIECATERRKKMLASGKWVDDPAAYNDSYPVTIVAVQRKKEGKEKTMLEQLKSFDKDRLNFDEAIALLTFGKAMISTYEGEEAVVPGWLAENVSSLQNEVHAKLRDSLLKAEKEAQREIDGLRSAEEKKAEATDRLAKIRAKLGK